MGLVLYNCTDHSQGLLSGTWHVAIDCVNYEASKQNWQQFWDDVSSTYIDITVQMTHTYWFENSLMKPTL